VDNAYGVYLSQLLFITFLNDHGWRNLSERISWPLVILMTVVIVYACGIVLTSLLARTPLAVPLTGRKQVPWSTLIPQRWRPAPAPAPAPAAPAAPALSTPREPAALAGTTDNQNGTRS
jgi:peptidoglycan/LPS O-acetylase OafA/YrhL